MLATPQLDTARLRLEPLALHHAEEMGPVLSDAGLYAFTGGAPPTIDELWERYARQIAGPPAGTEEWHNWIVRRTGDGAAIGYVQATIDDVGADVAWVIGAACQGQGFASEAARAMVQWLRGTRGVTSIEAHVHPDHAASGRVAERIGLRDTGERDDEGEAIWRS